MLHLYFSDPPPLTDSPVVLATTYNSLKVQFNRFDSSHGPLKAYAVIISKSAGKMLFIKVYTTVPQPVVLIPLVVLKMVFGAIHGPLFPSPQLTANISNVKQESEAQLDRLSCHSYRT